MNLFCHRHFLNVTHSQDGKAGTQGMFENKLRRSNSRSGEMAADVSVAVLTVWRHGYGCVSGGTHGLETWPRMCQWWWGLGKAGRELQFVQPWPQQWLLSSGFTNRDRMKMTRLAFEGTLCTSLESCLSLVLTEMPL